MEVRPQRGFVGGYSPPISRYNMALGTIYPIFYLLKADYNPKP